MGLCGKLEMNMNADYPFMLPRIISIVDRRVTIEEGGKRETFAIEHRQQGECGFIAQSSTYEMLFRARPTRFEMRPFKDEHTPAVGVKA